MPITVHRTNQLQVNPGEAVPTGGQRQSIQQSDHPAHH